MLESVELGVASYHPVRKTVELAQAAEHHGFARFWLAEQYYFRSAIPLATGVALGTSSIGIGLGVLNWFTRLAPLIAMETATLDETSGGRVTLGLGAGRTPASHLGLELTKTVTGLRETLDITRRLLAGEALGFEGQIYNVAPDAMRLGFAPRRRQVPVYLAGMGPHTLRLAAQHSDGVFLDVFTSPGFVTAMRPRIEAAATAAGRSLDELFFGTYAVFAVDHDGRAARDLVKPTLVDYLRARKIADERIELAGIDRDTFLELRGALQSAWQSGGIAEAVKCLPDWVCDKLAVCGTPDECCQALERFAQSGIRTAVLFNVLGKDPIEAIRLTADEIVPEVCR